MSVFTQMAENDHEQVVICRDEGSGLQAIIAIHDTTLGPALGGCRMWNFGSFDEALDDALRLSRGMTYKAAVAGLDLGGGKSVIIGDAKTQKSEELFRAFGRFVESLNGRYITAEDVGTSPLDMSNIHRETNHVRGCSRGSGGSGDPSPITAFGVFCGLQAAASWKFGRNDLHGLTVAVQGAGHVGYHLSKELARVGCTVLISDIDAGRAAKVQEECGARVVPPEEFFDQECDIIAPCALGASLNADTIPRIQAKVVAGAANNQLADEQSGEALQERDILYAPDYVVNAGGLINVWYEGPNYRREAVMDEVASIRRTTRRVFEISEAEGLLPEQAALRLAENRLNSVARLKRVWCG